MSGTSAPLVELQCDTRGRGLERGLVVHAARIPEHPPLHAVRVAGLDLRPHLRGRVVRRPEGEVLIPRAQGGGAANGCRSAVRVLQSVCDRLVRMRVRIRYAVRPRIVMRGIHHRQHDVDGVDELLPLLSDAHVGGVRCGETEYTVSYTHLTLPTNREV